MSTLSRQNSAIKNTYSLARDNQLRDQLESYLLALLGAGVLSGGLVSSNSGLSVKVASGTVLAAQGVTLTLLADAIYNGCADNATNTVWGRILRAAADPTHPADLDTYSLSLTSNTTDLPPTADHFRLAIVTTLSGAILAIQNAVSGKTPRLLQPWDRHRRDLAAGEFQHVAAGEQWRWRGPVTLAAGSQLAIESGGQVVID